MFVRTITYLLILAAGAGSAFAQAPVSVALEGVKDKLFFFNESVHFGIGPDAANDEAIQTVKSALNLSDVQVNALRTLVTMRAQAAEQIAQSMMESQRKLEDLLNQTSPNATDVGAAFLATRQVETQMRASNDKFRSDFRALLSIEQRAALDKLTAASKSLIGLQALGVVEGEGVSMGVHTGHAIRIENR